MLANSKAFSKAESKGLHRTGVLGSNESASRSSVVNLLHNTLLVFSGFSDSKLMIVSKQPSNPSLLRTLFT